MTKNRLVLPILVLSFSILLSGCISLKSKKTEPAPIPKDGGFYSLGKDKEGNYVWSQNVVLSSANSQKLDFKDVDLLTMVKDPQDEKAIYIGTKTSGLYYTYDGGSSWFQVEKFKKSQIDAIGISYKNKCLIYVATGSELYRSEDCNRTWKRMYNEARVGFYISALAVDSYNEGIIYIGLSTNTAVAKDKRWGEVIKSIDFGNSWQPSNLRTASGSIVSKILINPKDTRIVYAATNEAGVFKTINGGEGWWDITGVAQEVPKKRDEDFVQRFEKLIDFSNSTNAKEQRDSLIFRDMEFIPDKDDALIHASNYGLLKSENGGDTWSNIELIPPKGEKKSIIYSLDINPKNSNEFYYGTNNTLFKTLDGGQNWTTIKGPSTRAIFQIIVVPNSSGDTSVYAGMYNLTPPPVKKK